MLSFGLFVTDKNVNFVNGRAGKDTDSDFTFVSAAGCSVVDYFIISSELFVHVRDFEILHVDMFDHFPLLYTMKVNRVQLKCYMLQDNLKTQQLWKKIKSYGLMISWTTSG